MSVRFVLQCSYTIDSVWSIDLGDSMNFKIDVDMTPDEMRRVLGLPDIAGFQQEMLDQIRERMAAGADGYDPLTLFKPYMTGGLGSMEALQQMMLKMMTNYKGASKEAGKASD